MLNVSVVGLALIFEMIRNLFLEVNHWWSWCRTRCPREIRESIQSRIIAFDYFDLQDICSIIDYASIQGMGRTDAVFRFDQFPNRCAS